MTIKEELSALQTEFDKVQKELLAHMAAKETLEEKLAKFDEFKELADTYKAQAEKLTTLLETLAQQSAPEK